MLQFFFQVRRNGNTGPPGVRLIVQVDALTQKRVAFADLVAMDCHEQYLLLTDEHHTLFCAGNASVEQISIEHDSTQVYAHILDEDRKVNAQKFEMAFYANADLRGVEQRLRAESAVAEPDSEILLKQLEAKPELMDAFTKKFVEQYGEQIMNQLAKKLIGA